MGGSGMSGGPMAARHAVRTAVATLAAGVLSLLAVPLVSSTAIPSAGAATSPGTVWLCRPGTALDPSAHNASSTSVSARGATSVTPSPAPLRNAKRFDCFYVYPTVSTEKTDNANLVVQPAEVAAAAAQASRFSQVCNVWAPMYRQATDAAITDGSATKRTVIGIAYSSLLSAWRDYLLHDNDGRPIVFIGHSQGAAMLIKLLRSQVDPSPVLRRQLLSAIILGGNVQVPVGRDVGGSFRHIPACRSITQRGCVIAYSTFPSTPPPLVVVRTAGSGRQPPVGADHQGGAARALCQPGHVLGHGGGVGAVFLDGDGTIPRG